MEVNKESKSESMKKSFFKYPNFDEFMMKVDVESFSYNNLLQEFKVLKNVVYFFFLSSAFFQKYSFIVFIIFRNTPLKPNKFQTSVQVTVT